jgi:hypothetical protein
MAYFVSICLFTDLYSYSIWDESLGAVVASYPPARDGPGYIDCLSYAFEDIFEILKSSDT